MDIPTLDIVKRDREYNSYPQDVRDEIVYQYLFKGKSHRQIDEEILKINPDYSRGWQSMGVLHHMGLKNNFKSIFAEYDIDDAIKLLKGKDYAYYKNVIQSLIRYLNGIYQENSIDYFIPNPKVEPLYKNVGSSQYTDGVRIDQEFHCIFNPINSEYYSSRGTARKIKILFNNKIFDAEYRFEGQIDTSVTLQSIRFRKELKDEFKKVFPNPSGRFKIQQGFDINHFIFDIVATSHTGYSELDDITIEDFPEGKESYRLHRIRERNPKLIKQAKEQFKKEHGRLYCQICGFDFNNTYGQIGFDYIEGHHNKPISQLPEGYRTKIEDIILVCSNCHKMLHRRRPWLKIEELKDLLK